MTMRVFVAIGWLAIVLMVVCAKTVHADYKLPTFDQVVAGSTAIIDATVEGLDEQGRPVLKVHDYFKGKNAATTIIGVCLSCTGELPRGVFAPGQRYVIALNRDRLFEGRTIYPVRDGRDGKSELWYRDVQTLASETLTFAEFRKRVTEARERSVVKEQVVVAGLQSPLRWLADSKLDPAAQPLRGWLHSDTLVKLIDGAPRPWTVEQLVEVHRRALADAAKAPAGETAEERYQRHLRTVAPMHTLAVTRDVRAVIALGEALSSSVESVPKSAAAVLRDTYQATPTWPNQHKNLVDAARAWWKEHEEVLRTELRSLIAAEKKKE